MVSEVCYLKACKAIDKMANAMLVQSDWSVKLVTQ